jgi:2-(1,2-epoxy-1,2-dihydrophenyl)acetyl-CoA isomerase
MTREQQPVEGLRCPTTRGVVFSETNGVATIRLNVTTTAFCGGIAAVPTWARGRAKRLLRSAETTPLETQLAHERSAFLECVATADFAEGLKAFVDRRRPVFVGA